MYPRKSNAPSGTLQIRVFSALVATVGDARDFTNGRQFAAWLGLVPRQNSSGGMARHGRITKRGDRYLRTLLVHGARAVLIRNAEPRRHQEPMGATAAGATGLPQGQCGAGGKARAHPLGDVGAQRLLPPEHRANDRRAHDGLMTRRNHLPRDCDGAR